MAASDPDGRIGTVLDGRYRVIEPLSRGGMGIVYRAERVPVGRQVAVKFLHALFAEDRDSRARFERETRALSKLAHPHCVSIIDFGYDGAPYLVMDLVAGRTLREILDDGPLPIEDALTIARQILAGLAHAHAEGIVHRDIKPANIMVSDQIGSGRHARILDFGLARLAERGAANITQSQIAIGTPSYMAPEQTRGEATDARTDLYAVGVLLFEMVTGERPFVAEETAALLDLHRHQPPPRLAEFDASRTWPAGLDAAIQKALAKDPGERWQSAVEFAEALQTRRATSIEEAAPAGSRSGGRRRAFLLGVLLATAAAVFAFVELRKREKAAANEVADGAPALMAGTVPGAGLLDAAEAVGIAPVDGGGVANDAAPEALIDAAGDAAPEALIDAAADAAPDATIDAPIDAAPAADVDAAPAAAAAMPADEDDIELEPVAPADPEIETVDQNPDPLSPDEPEVAAPPVPARPAVVPKAAPAPIRTVAQALAAAKKGRRDDAITALRGMWRKQPRSANLPYLLGNLYTDKRWFPVAIEHYQAAISRSAAYRRNSTLIRNTIGMLSSPRSRAKASWFLRKVVGAPAKGHLRVAAKRHKSAVVRKHAADVLRRF